MQQSGYTQLNRFGKPILSNNDRIVGDKLNTKTPVVATTDQNGISGEIENVLRCGEKRL